MNGHQKMFTFQEVVNSLLALDLAPTPSPKLKALFPPRVHKQGCSPEMSIYQVSLRYKKRKKFLIGMLYALPMVERKKGSVVKPSCNPSLSCT